jgi:hypothetical protein
VAQGSACRWQGRPGDPDRRAIAGRGKCLLILDNFEQVARHAEETLGQWLNRRALPGSW